MSIYVSPALVLVETAADANLPRIGIQSVLTVLNVSADEEAAGFPATNLANVSTAERWKGTSTDVQYVTIAEGATQSCNYFAIARHNLGSTGGTVKLQRSADSVTWTDVTEALAPANDTAIIYRFDSITSNYWRLELTPGSEAPTIAVLYLGQLITLQRRIYVGHTPITLGRQWAGMTGRSSSGQFLGRVLRSEWRVSQVTLSNLTPGWVRDTLDPFIAQAATRPFFWAWRPDTWPDECGYVWVDAPPVPQNSLPNGMMQVSMDLKGIA